MNPRFRPLVLILAWAAAFGGIVGCSSEGPETLPEEAVRHNVRGGAYMSQQKWSEAETEFRAGLEVRADDPILLNNTAVALLQQNRVDEAEALLVGASEIDRRDPFVRYNLGLIAKNRGAFEEARDHFASVVEVDADDVFGQYNLGATLARLDRDAEAEAAYRAALRRNPTHVSSLYGLGRLLVKTGRADEGGALIARSQEIREQSGIDEAMGTQYGEQGPYAMVAEHPGGGVPAPAAIPVSFAVRSAVVPVPNDATRPGFVLAGPRDALVPVVAYGGTVAAPGGGLEFPESRVVAIAAADLDGDDVAELVALTERHRTLEIAIAPVEGGRVGAARIAATSRRDSLHEAPDGAIAAVDVDHDGDVDLVWCVTSPRHSECRLAVNDGAGALEERTPDPPWLPAPAAGPIAIAFTDHDNDRDVDLVIARPSGVRLLSNLRDGRFGDVSDAIGLGAAGPGGPVRIADLDKNGFMDVVVATERGPLLYANTRGRFAAPSALVEDAGRGGTARGIAVFDHDNDGFLDVSWLDDGGVRTARNAGLGNWELRDAGPGDDAGVRALFAAADADDDGDLDLWAIGRDGLAVIENDGGSVGAWVRLAPDGVRDNAFGVGTKVTVMSGALRQKFEVVDARPVHLGLGSRDGVDAVRLLWPGGVLQDELDLAPRETARIEQLDRKGTSCPLLYAYRDGAWRFVTDFLGGCAIGYQHAPGRFVLTPDTDEYVKIETGLDVVPAADTPHGEVRVRLNNQLEEVIWFDLAELVAVDHPEGTELFPQEALMPGPPYSAFRLFASGDIRDIRRARSIDTGADVTAALAERDRDYVDDFGLLPFKGYAEPHALEIDLGSVPRDGRVVLLLDGWIDYADSSSNVAAGHAGAVLSPPRLSVPDGRGGWETPAGHRTGFPAGLPKTMTIDLTDVLRRDDPRVRLDTTMRIYWDRARVLVGGEDTPLAIHRVAPRAAALRFGGFPEEVRPDGRKPGLYDPTTAAATSPWKAHVGTYTRYGEVRGLLGEIDDRFVTTRNGDEIELRFAAPAPPAEGFTRTWLLYADGFGKDMDPNSRASETVGPIPYHGMPPYPYAAADALAREPDTDERGRVVPPSAAGTPGTVPLALRTTASEHRR